MSDLEALEAVAGLRLLADYVKNGVDELGAFGVVALGKKCAYLCSCAYCFFF